MQVPSHGKDIGVSFPTPQILLITLQRGEFSMMNQAMQQQLSTLMQWYDREPSLRCAIMTGNGRGFCVGADLKEWLAMKAANPEANHPEVVGGFGGVSRRKGKKPLIAAVNGMCLGGGMEMAVNCDLVVASERAVFGTPEVKRGVFAKMGAIGRLVRFIGLQRASELLLTGEDISAQTALQWGLINRVVPHDKLMETAMTFARQICVNSPDSVIVSRTGILASLEHGSLERSTQVHNESAEVALLERGENIREGLAAFKEKRGTKWQDSKL
jgi:enoyl-CoA hydratase/carnithine racemase